MEMVVVTGRTLMCKAPVKSPPPLSTSVSTLSFYSLDAFLSPNQQGQSTEGKIHIYIYHSNAFIHWWRCQLTLHSETALKLNAEIALNSTKICLRNKWRWQLLDCFWDKTCVQLVQGTVKQCCNITRYFFSLLQARLDLLCHRGCVRQIVVVCNLHITKLSHLSISHYKTTVVVHFCMKLLKAEWEVNQQQGEEFKCYTTRQMTVAMLHSNGQLRIERDGDTDTEKGCQKPAL